MERKRLALHIFVWAVLLAVTAALLSGFFLRTDTLGAHDWDAMSAHRYYSVKAIRDFGQFPGWNPYACGGYAAWGSPEGASHVVNPLLPAFLWLPLPAAIRVEIVFFLAVHLAGAWFFAKRYVSHPLALGLVCLLAVLNSRTALQIAVGHGWHLVYAGIPWALAALDRSEDGGRVRLRWLAAGAGILAAMTYAGGIYPVPHAALAMGIVAAYRAWAARSARPLAVCGAIVATGTALAAPKVLAVLDTMGRFPRHVSSRETIDPASWGRMFLSSVDDIPSYQVEGLDWMWHEYGLYIGPIALAAILWANLRRRLPEPALGPLRFTGWSFMALALGGWGPWVLLHLVPPFRSQHVPSRFTYTALLLFAVVTARILELAVPEWRARLAARRAGPHLRRLLDAAVIGAFVVTAGCMAREDARATRPWFSLEVPAVPERTDGYVQHATVPSELRYGNGDPRSPAGTDGPPELLAIRANVGAVECTSFAGLNFIAPVGPNGRPPHLGARGLGDPLYRGEQYLEGSTGRVSLVKWTPNEVTLRTEGATPGGWVVLNQNWDPSWRANGAPTENRDNLNAARLTAASETVTFRFVPRTLGPGLAAFALALAAIPLAALLRALRRRRRGAPA